MKQDFITITNEDIYRELKEIKELGIKTHDQACKTNGRVTSLEKKSIGVWIAKHPFKFTIGVVVFISLLTPETREAVFSFANKIF